MYRWTFRAYNNAAKKQVPDLVSIVVVAADYDEALAKAKYIPGLGIRKVYDLVNVVDMSTGA